MAPDRFRNAFRIRFRLVLPFGVITPVLAVSHSEIKTTSIPCVATPTVLTMLATTLPLLSLSLSLVMQDIMLPKATFVLENPLLWKMAYVLMGLLLSLTKTPQKTLSSMCLALIPQIFLSSKPHQTFFSR